MSTPETKILTWNVAQGRGTTAALHLADRVGADVVLLQESFPPPKWGSDSRGSVVPGRKWGSWILVREGRLVEMAVDGFKGWVTAARWRHGSRSTVLASLHSPTSNDTDSRGSYVDEARRAVDTILGASRNATRHIIGGDFNFKFFGPHDTTQADGATKKEIVTMQHFATLGFGHVWADCHPGAPLAQTLRWTKDRSIPYHCDGFLVRPPAGMDAVCEVLASVFITRHSDHNAVFAVIS